VHLPPHLLNILCDPRYVATLLQEEHGVVKGF
jgi:hypothetical protein